MMIKLRASLTWAVRWDEWAGSRSGLLILPPVTGLLCGPKLGWDWWLAETLICECKYKILCSRHSYNLFWMAVIPLSVPASTAYLRRDLLGLEPIMFSSDNLNKTLYLYLISAFARLQEVTIGFVMFLWLSVLMEQLTSDWMDFHENLFQNFSKICREYSNFIQIWQE